MTTVHLTNAYHPTSGGIRTFYDALLEGGDRERRRVVLIVPGARTDVQDVGRFGRIHTVAAPPAPAFDRRYRLMLPYRLWPGGIIGQILERERPSVVEICDKYSLPYLAGMLRKGWHRAVARPALVGLSCERFDDNMAAYLSRRPAARAFTQWYLRQIYGPPFDIHVANSAYTASELHEALPDRPTGFIRVCPMGVDTAGFGPHRASATMRERMRGLVRGSQRSVLLFHAGRLSPEKNVELLVAMLRTLVEDQEPGSDYRLIIAGDGPEAGWLRAQATGALRDRLVLVGNLARSTLAECCASADVFVHPNPREPFGIGPLEAMASGVPVVVPAAGGVLEYATESNSWLAAPTARDFARAVRSARDGDAARVAAARDTARRFQWDLIARRFFAIYDEAAERYSMAPAQRPAEASRGNRSGLSVKTASTPRS